MAASHVNRLVALLGSQDRKRLLASGERVELAPGALLFERGEEIGGVYFPTDGAVLLSAPAHSPSGIGVVLVGREGMVGAHHVLGSNVSSLRAVVLTQGAALCVGAKELSELLKANLTLHRALLAYAGEMLSQVAAAAACTRVHTIRPRLAGWLLILRDRGDADSFRITHDALARMLGVRRAGVTAVAGELHRSRLIDCHRGQITILNVPGLRAVAGPCYLPAPSNDSRATSIVS